MTATLGLYINKSSQGKRTCDRTGVLGDEFVLLRIHRQTLQLMHEQLITLLSVGRVLAEAAGKRAAN